MYVPRPFESRDRGRFIAHMRSHGFAMLVTHCVESGLSATHVPVTVDVQHDDGVGDVVRLYGHVAAANPQVRALARAVAHEDVLVIFRGPHAYISPDAFDERSSVPTWDYTAVHAYGTARLIRDQQELLTILSAVIGQYQPAYQARWDNLPESYRQKMANAIVGFEITVSRLLGSFKLSQNKKRSERRRIVAALRRTSEPESWALSNLIESTLPAELASEDGPAPDTTEQ